MLELYHHGTSACAAKVRLALAVKGLAWQGHYVDILAGEQFAPEFLALNPKAVVPVLVHDGEVIVESTVICEYLDDAFADNPIYPAAALASAQVRIWAKGVDEELHPACSALTYIVSHRHTIVRNGAGSFESFVTAGGAHGRAERERKWRWIQDGLDAPGAADFLRIWLAWLDRMEAALTDGNWLVGDELTMADIALAPYLFRLDCLALDCLWLGGRRPAVAQWYARMKGDAAFEQAVVDWLPAALGSEMRSNGERSRDQVVAMLEAE